MSEFLDAIYWRARRLSTVVCVDCSSSLVLSQGALEPRDHGLQGRVLFQAALGDVDRVHDRRVVAREDLADVRERGGEESSAEVHCDLSGRYHVAAPSLAAEVGGAQPKVGADRI